jgi:hypothetical protein
VGSRAAARKAGKTCGSETASSLLPFLAGSDLQQTKRTHTTIDFTLFSVFLDLHFSLLLLGVCFTAGQFVMGFVFFSSASGGRSGDATVADVVDDADGSVGAADLAVCC